MGGPPHPQTPEDRAALLPILLLFAKFPRDFEFPLEVDPRYVPPINSFYCFVTGVVMCVISTTVVCLRLWVRSRGAFGMDDWVMLAAFVCAMEFFGKALLLIWSIFDGGSYLIVPLILLIWWVSENSEHPYMCSKSNADSERGNRCVRGRFGVSHLRPFADGYP